MSRLLGWIEDNYPYLAAIMVIAVFAFGGIASMCDKDDASVDFKRKTLETKAQIDSNRADFYGKYREYFPQFPDERGFSMWLDDADKESIALLHALMEAVGDEYDGDEGFADMIEYLHANF